MQNVHCQTGLAIYQLRTSLTNKQTISVDLTLNKPIKDFTITGLTKLHNSLYMEISQSVKVANH